MTLRLLRVANVYNGQAPDDMFTHRLELRGQGQLGAEILQRFIHREARRVGGDLEEHAARLAEIDGVEIFAVHHGCDVVTLRGDQRAPGTLLLIAGRAKGHVMYTAGGDMSG